MTVNQITFEFDTERQIFESNVIRLHTTFEASTQLCDRTQASLFHRINNTVETFWGNFLLHFLKPSVII